LNANTSASLNKKINTYQLFTSRSKYLGLSEPSRQEYEDHSVNETENREVDVSCPLVEYYRKLNNKRGKIDKHGS
jgi:hypothetical protein